MRKFIPAFPLAVLTDVLFIQAVSFLFISSFIYVFLKIDLVMKAQNLILIFSFLLTFQLNAQVVKRSLTRQEAYSYSNLVGNYLDANDTNIIKKTELVMMLLEMDTIGRVTKIHLMAENQEEKSLYEVLKGITPEYFNDKRVIYGARKKTIIFPIYSLTYWSDDKNYLDKMRTPWCPFLTEDMSATVQEGMHFIQVNGITHVVQAPPPKKKPTADEILEMTNSVEKKNNLKKGSAAEKNKRKIYAAVMNDFCKEKTWGYVIEDSTRNREIYIWGYDRYIEALSVPARKGGTGKLLVDSSWLPFLKSLNTKTIALRTVKVPEFETVAHVYILNKDTIAALRDNGTVGSGLYGRLGWMQGKLEVSDILFSDKNDMAIVELSNLCGSLCGEGMLVLLQREKDKKWKVVFKIGTWIS
jgi:hypothetical protein